MGIPRLPEVLFLQTTFSNAFNHSHVCFSWDHRTLISSEFANQAIRNGKLPYCLVDHFFVSYLFHFVLQPHASSAPPCVIELQFLVSD